MPILVLEEEATYRISTAPGNVGDKCANPACGHSVAAHGSNGRICCRCQCTQYVPAPRAGAHAKAANG